MRYLLAVLLLSTAVLAGVLTDWLDDARDNLGNIGTSIFNGAAAAGIGLLPTLWTALSNAFAEMLNAAIRVNAAVNPLGTTDAFMSSADGQRIKVTGHRFPDFDSYLGIPYAEPLTGRKRFDAPTPFKYTGDLQALTHGKACIQPLPFLDGVTGQSEDCHYLSVVTPRGAAEEGKKLPVMVWIYGGGFFGGSGSYYSTIAPLMVKKSVQLGQPVVHVAMNYRLGIQGFGLGAQMLAAGAANNGIRDSKLAVQWVREHIASFGGDPDNITLYGESAGAISTGIHLLDPRAGEWLKGAILQSGHPSTIPCPRTDEYQAPYDDFVKLAGCEGNEDTLECLRGLSEDRIAEVTATHSRLPQYELGITAVIWRPSIDGDIIPDSPYKLQEEGRFANVPIVTGTNKDEGTLFVPWLVSSEEELRTMINHVLPRPVPEDGFATLFATYPNDPEKGSPFGTGRNTFLLNPRYKQASAIATDALFVSKSRWQARTANAHGNARVWRYAFEAKTGLIPPFLGVMHATDLLFTYGLVNKALPLGWTSKSERVSQAMMAYWIAFANKQDPNTDGQPNWPAHTGPNARNAMLFSDAGVYPIPDTYRDDQIKVFEKPEVYSLFFS